MKRGLDATWGQAPNLGQAKRVCTARRDQIVIKPLRRSLTVLTSIRNRMNMEGQGTGPTSPAPAEPGTGGQGQGQQVVPETPNKFFSIWIPPEDNLVSHDKCCVLTPKDFKDSGGAILKRNPRARFVKCDTEEEAWAALQDAKLSSPIAVATMETPRKEVAANTNNNDVGEGSNDVAVMKKRRRGRLSLPALNSPQLQKDEEPKTKKVVGEEKDTRFPTPKIQELTAMGREINAKNIAAVIARIEANPKMLINDCDRPTTVQEGCRYNALHIAAKSDNHEILSYILNKVGSYEFMNLMYPNKTPDAIRDQIRYVTDAYLNTPDKMANETPLHFATKHLSSNAAKVLISHPWCNIDVINSFNETPQSIIGNRANQSAQDFMEKREAIQKMFTDVYIVPIWRDDDGFRTPSIGPVACFRKLGRCIPKCFLKSFPNFDVELLDPCDKGLLPESKRPFSTTSFNSSFSKLFEETNEWKISAFAGPTNREEADDLLSALKQGRTGFVREAAGISPTKNLIDSFTNLTINSPKGVETPVPPVINRGTPPSTIFSTINPTSVGPTPRVISGNMSPSAVTPPIHPIIMNGKMSPPAVVPAINSPRTPVYPVFNGTRTYPGTPPRTPLQSFGRANLFPPSSPFKHLLVHNNSPHSPGRFLSPEAECSAKRLTDGAKGLERYAMRITLDYGIQWNEYWDGKGNAVDKFKKSIHSKV